MMDIVLFLLLGLSAGILSGMFGIGGGIIIIPVLLYVFKFSQHMAQGTTLALMIPPIGILAAWEYYKHGYVNIQAVLFICLGFVLGGLIGAKFVPDIPSLILTKMFGMILLIIAVRMIFFK